MKNRRPLAQALCMAAGLAANAYAEPVKQPFHVGMDVRAFLSYGAYPHPGSGVTMGENLGFLLAVPASFHRVEAKVSVGGFFHLLPAAMSNPGATNWHGYRNGGIELDELYLRIPFRPFDFGSSLTAGSFRWKSNPDAVRTGEYLTRYAAYPTAPVREAMPWDPADSLSVPVLGMKLAVATPGGRWSQNALVLVEPPGTGRDDGSPPALLRFPGCLLPSVGGLSCRLAGFALGLFPACRLPELAPRYRQIGKSGNGDKENPPPGIQTDQSLDRGSGPAQ